MLTYLVYLAFLLKWSTMCDDYPVLKANTTKRIWPAWSVLLEANRQCFDVILTKDNQCEITYPLFRFKTDS